MDFAHEFGVNEVYVSTELNTGYKTSVLKWCREKVDVNLGGAAWKHPSRDAITLHKSRWIILRSKPEILRNVVVYITPIAYCITLIRVYSTFLISDQRILQKNGIANM